MNTDHTHANNFDTGGTDTGDSSDQLNPETSVTRSDRPAHRRIIRRARLIEKLVRLEIAQTAFEGKRPTRGEVKAAAQSIDQRIAAAVSADELAAALATLDKIAESLGGRDALPYASRTNNERRREDHGSRRGRGHRAHMHERHLSERHLSEGIVHGRAEHRRGRGAHHYGEYQHGAPHYGTPHRGGHRYDAPHALHCCQH